MLRPQPLRSIRWVGALIGIGVGLVLDVLVPGAQWAWLVPLLAILGWWGLPRLVDWSTSR
jgi:hypothetical protein